MASRILEQRTLTRQAQSEARCAGSKTYSTGIPCKRGHICPRFLSTRACIECNKLYRTDKVARKEKWQSRSHEECEARKADIRAYYQRNKERIQIYDRVRNKTQQRRASDNARNKTEKRQIYRKSARWLEKYGVTYGEIETIRIAQDNKCWICLTEFNLKSHKPDSMAVDHCHTTGVIRGLLCAGCNSGLGYFRDSHAFLERAIAYLAR